MKQARIIAALAFLFVSLALSAQGRMELGDALERIAVNYDYSLYIQESVVDSLEVQLPSLGEDPRPVLIQLLRGTGLNHYIQGSELYIYPGRSIVRVLPEYEKPQSSAPLGIFMLDQEENTEAAFLQTRDLSEEKFLVVGSESASGRGLCDIRGRIINQQNDEALIGATIFVVETSKGVITDADGYFDLRLNRGEYTIRVNHMAMKEVEYGLKVLSSGAINLLLENEIIELEEVTVSDQRHSNVQGMMMGFERISTKAMKEIPAVMGERDVLKVAQLLPGVQSSGEGSSGFNVRGGSADQNMFYINGISVYNTSHLFGFFTAFSPDIISDFSLYKNNIPARYGGRIASIFEIGTRPGRKDHFFAQGGISPITGHIALEGPVIKDRLSLVGSFRSSYSDWLLRRITDHDISQSTASFWDGTLGASARLGEKDQIRAFYYHSSDKFTLSDRNEYSYSNQGLSLSWKHSFSNRLSSEVLVASSLYAFESIDKNNISEAYSHAYQVGHNEGRLDFTLLLPNNRIEFGGSGIWYKLDRGEVLPFGPESTRTPFSMGQEQGLEGALYLSDEVQVLPWLSALLGIRYSHFANMGPASVQLYEANQPLNRHSMLGTEPYSSGQVVQDYGGFEPRAALKVELGNSASFKASYNRLYQYIFLLSNTFALAPNDQWKLTDSYIKPPMSDQVSLGLYKDLKGAGLSISLEVYRKWINNLVEYKDGADFISPLPVETQVSQGEQEAKGVELMIRKSGKKLSGWMSYTYSRSMVLVNGVFDEERINGGKAYPSNFDKPNSFNLVANYRFRRRLSISSNVVYSTGRPTTLPISAYYAEGNQYLVYSDRNDYRIPDYFRIDLSVNLEGNLKSKKFAHSYWMLNIYNVTGRHNAYNVFYELEEGQIKGYQLSIFAQPIVTLSWNFKFGNYNSD